MKNKVLSGLFLTAIAVASVANVSTAKADGPYHLLKEIAIGGEGGWDYASVDDVGRRLYVSHASKVVVIDIDKNTIVGEMTNMNGVHGIALAHDLGKAFVSNGRSNDVSVVDLKTLGTLSRVATEKNPDAILFEPEHKEVYAFNGRSESATVIDATSSKVVTNVALGGKPEFAQADPANHRVYNNLEDKSELIAIDTKAHAVVNRWPIAPGEEASGMAFDEKNHRLFLGCGNKLMVMMDSQSGKVVAQVPIGDGVDANAFDAGTMLAFASCGDGTTTIAHEDAPDKLTVVQTLQTVKGSRTMTIDPKTHNIYLAAAEFEPLPEGQTAGEHHRPKMKPGTFKVMVYGMDAAKAKP